MCHLSGVFRNIFRAVDTLPRIPGAMGVLDACVCCLNVRCHSTVIQQGVQVDDVLGIVTAGA